MRLPGGTFMNVAPFVNLVLAELDYTDEARMTQSEKRIANYLVDLELAKWEAVNNGHIVFRVVSHV